MRIDSIVCWLLAGCSIAVAGPSVMRGTPLPQPANSSGLDARALRLADAPSSSESTNRSYESNGQRELPTLSYCDLMKNQEQYKSKPVRLKASWQFRFEVSSLYDPLCSDQPQAWLDFADEKVWCPETKTNIKVPRESAREAEVTVT